MTKQLWAATFFTISAISASAQPSVFCDSSQSSSSRGDIKVIADKRLGDAIVPAPTNGDHQPVMSGYRVQVYSGKDREEAMRIKSEMETMYPNTPAYFVYESPYYKIKVGDFRTTLDAQRLLHDLGESYRGVILVPEKINLPSID